MIFFWTDADRLRASQPVPVVPDPDPISRRQAEQLLGDYLAETKRRSVESGRLSVLESFPIRADPLDAPSAKAVLGADPALRVACIRVALDWSLQRVEQYQFHSFDWYELDRLSALTSQLLRRRLLQPYQEADVIYLLQRIAASSANWRLMHNRSGYSLQAPLRSIQRWAESKPLPEAAVQALRQVRANFSDAESHAEGRAMLELIDQMLGVEQLAEDLIDPSDDWGHAAAEVVAGMPPEERVAWLALLRFAVSAKGTKPSGKWRNAAREEIERLGTDSFRGQAVRWLGLLNAPSRNVTYRRPDGVDYPSAWVADRNADPLKGLAWCCATLDDERLAQALGDAAVAAFKKIPMYGARCTKAGNACVLALGEMPSLAAVAQLQRLSERVKLPSARKLIEGALETASTHHGLSRDELDDVVAPSFGLEAGRALTPLGSHTAELVVSGSSDVELRWLRPDGGRRSSVPAEVKPDFAPQLKELQQSVKNARAALQVQRARLERLLLAERSWRLADWRAQYLDHGLRAPLARRLFWSFGTDGQEVQGAWLDGRIVDVEDQPLDGLSDETQVRLWHPIGSTPATVLAWRRWLERHEVSQPFKQAHREVYILTDAERTTGTYSNRFAAHILRQHQFQALCQQRGWSYRLQGAWDGYNTPTLGLPRHGLRAKFVVEAIWDTGDSPGEGTLSGHGISLYAGTHQARFSRPGSLAPVPLDQVPPVVFSEVMRDLDLFVGVCSVGNDPNWLDRGVGSFNDYWWQFSFGSLSATAETRRAVLERLLPRLAKLAGRWSLGERFLEVRGDLRSYKIHLGSGNVLMEPNDQYLCIVQGGSADNLGGNRLFLPFEDDPTLSLILSKAFLLAEDRTITDPTITRQLRSD